MFQKWLFGVWGCGYMLLLRCEHQQPPWVLLSRSRARGEAELPVPRPPTSPRRVWLSRQPRWVEDGNHRPPMSRHPFPFTSLRSMWFRDIRNLPPLVQCLEAITRVICRSRRVDLVRGCVTTTASSRTTRCPPSLYPATTCPYCPRLPPTPSSLPVSILLVWYLRIFRLVTCPASPSTWPPVSATGLRSRWRTTRSLQITTFSLLMSLRSWQDPVPTLHILMMSKYPDIYGIFKLWNIFWSSQYTYFLGTLSLKFGQCVNNSAYFKNIFLFQYRGWRESASSEKIFDVSQTQ